MYNTVLPLVPHILRSYRLISVTRYVRINLVMTSAMTTKYVPLYISVCQRGKLSSYTSFVYLMKTFIKEGIVLDAEFDCLGFEPDRDIRGYIISRLARINQDHLQRIKCLTHSFQEDLRDERLKLIYSSLCEKLSKKGITLQRD